MPEIKFGIFSEDIRVEASGQITAVGMWGSRCTVSAFPFQLRSFAFTAFLENPEATPYPFAITVEGPMNPGAPLRHEGVLTIQQPGKGGNFVGLILGPLTLPQEGTIRVGLKISSDPTLEQTFELQVRPLAPPAP